MEHIVASLGEISESDYLALDLLGDSLSMYYYAEAELGNGITVVNVQGNIVPHPCVRVKMEAQKEVFKLMKVLGLTTIDRKRLEKLDECKEEEVSPLEAFFDNENN